nr:putative reverse transcriptase domain-containing protein [Tanacetum cinerariifolium]
MDPSKIEAVKNWKALTMPLEIRSFFGLAIYYQRLIPHFSKIAKPLTSLTQKNQKYEWGEKEEEAFQTLKNNLCDAPILSLPDGIKDFVVYYDASNQGLGCVLMQRGKVIAYTSRQHKIHEMNYTIHDLELGAVVFALKTWRLYLYGTKCVIYTDHKSLQYIFDQKELNMRQRRRIKLFSNYECEIRYHPGKANVVADALSRKERVPLVGNVRMIILNEAHTSRYYVHPGADKMYHDLRNIYWWLGMRRDIAIYDKITMDLITKLHRSRSGRDAIWVIIDILTKLAHFLAIRKDFSTEKLAILYNDVIGARHGVPVSIISNRDERFTSNFWQTVQKALGTRLDLSTAYHPQTNGKSKHTIQTLKDMLRAYVIDFGGSSDVHLPLAEFSYNNAYHSSIRCAPFEALYGRKSRSPVLWAEIREGSLIGPELVLETTNKVVLIKEKLKAGVVRFRKKGKLAPRYVGPIEILERIGLVAYRLRLPEELKNVHDTFHVSNLKRCLTDANLHVPLDEIKVDKTLHFVEKPIVTMEKNSVLHEMLRGLLMGIHGMFSGMYYGLVRRVTYGYPCSGLGETTGTSDEPLEEKKLEIDPLIRESPNTFLMGDEAIELNFHGDIDDIVPIPRVSKKPLDFLI